MTPDQAIETMGSPDAKDSIPDPEVKGGELLRYTWSSRGKAATFSRDNRLTKIEDVQRTAAADQSQNFDPIATPLSYVFYPVRVVLEWVGSGINCVAENSCHSPPPVPGPGT